MLTLIFPVVLVINALIFYLQNKIWVTQMGISAANQPATLTLAFLAAPLLAYSFGSLIGLLSFLVSKPAVLQAITFFIVYAIEFGGSYLINDIVEHSSTDLVTWPVVGAYFSAAVIVWIITWFLSRTLDKDYVISHMA